MAHLLDFLAIRNVAVPQRKKLINLYFETTYIRILDNNYGPRVHRRRLRQVLK